MIVFARMGVDTPRMYVVYGMVIAGLGMGLLQPVYTLAVQNVAPRRQMGAATSSTIFFRSIGSTVGVAAFGSIMLTRYHTAFEQAMPAHVPAAALPYFANPLLLVQVRPQMEAAFARFPGGSGAAADAVRQRARVARQRPAPDLRLQRGHHGARRPAASRAAQRAAAHTRRGARTHRALINFHQGPAAGFNAFRAAVLGGTRVGGLTVARLRRGGDRDWERMGCFGGRAATGGQGGFGVDSVGKRGRGGEFCPGDRIVAIDGDTRVTRLGAGPFRRFLQAGATYRRHRATRRRRPGRDAHRERGPRCRAAVARRIAAVRRPRLGRRVDADRRVPSRPERVAQRLHRRHGHGSVHGASGRQRAVAGVST